MSVNWVLIGVEIVSLAVGFYGGYTFGKDVGYKKGVENGIDRTYKAMDMVAEALKNRRKKDEIDNKI